jgi:Spy/CpxP family protein refolding chaperone
MRPLLIVLVVLASSLLAQSAPQSQTPPPQAPAGHGILGNPEKFADAHLAAVDKAVSLSDQQKPRVRTVFVNEAKKLFAIFNDSTLSDEQKGRSIQSLHLTTLHLVAAELTQEQRQKFFNFMPDARPRPGVVQN